MRHVYSATLTVFSLAGLFALSACASAVPTFDAASASASPSASASSASASASASPSKSASVSPSASSAASTSASSAPFMEAELAPVNEFMNAIYEEGSAAQTNYDNFTDQIVAVLPPSDGSDANAGNTALIQTLSDADAQTILTNMQQTLPYAKTVSFEGQTVQQQVATLFAMEALSVKLNSGIYQYRNFSEMQGFTIVNFEGSDHITFQKLTSDTYVDGKLSGKSNPEENYDFAVVKTGDQWKIDGAKMLTIIESHMS